MVLANERNGRRRALDLDGTAPGVRHQYGYLMVGVGSKTYTVWRETQRHKRQRRRRISILPTPLITMLSGDNRSMPPGFLAPYGTAGNRRCDSLSPKVLFYNEASKHPSLAALDRLRLHPSPIYEERNSLRRNAPMLSTGHPPRSWRRSSIESLSLSRFLPSFRIRHHAQRKNSRDTESGPM